MAKYACVIVTYFPPKSSLEHIRRISDLCSAVIVVDNTPQAKTVAFPSATNLTVHKYRKNRGLARGLNCGIKIAGEKGFNDIFLLDQDSYVPNNFFGDMLRFKSQVDEKMPGCAVYVPDFWDRNSRSPAKFPIVSKFRIKHTTCKDMKPFQRHGAVIAITSGTLITYSL